MPRLALYQPDQAGNVGATIRLCACLGAPLDLIGPFGFGYDERKLKRAGMDYLELANVTRHRDFAAFQAAWQPATRLVLLTTRAEMVYHRFAFAPEDVLLFGSESAGVPDHVHETAEHRLTVPMLKGRRALNLVTACAVVLGEAVRQLGLPAVPDY